jgi:hypothetical protein
MEIFVVVLSILAIVPFVLGIVSMMVFYRYLHPNITNRRNMTADHEMISVRDQDSF